MWGPSDEGFRGAGWIFRFQEAEGWVNIKRKRSRLWPLNFQDQGQGVGGNRYGWKTPAEFATCVVRGQGSRLPQDGYLT